MRSMRARTMAAALAMACGIPIVTRPALSAPTCPLSDGTIDAAKSNTLFLYFPAADDATFPNFVFGVSPAKKFDVADLDPGIGTTAALRDRIQDVGWTTIVNSTCRSSRRRPIQRSSPRRRRGG